MHKERHLELYKKYSRQEVHDIFVPEGRFTPNAGTWGLHGCVHVPHTEHDYVFFVTYGQSQSGFIFQEGISNDGVMTWQSQPRQHLNEKRVKRWINQIENGDNIDLFARPQKRVPYTYLGSLSYLCHDPFKEYPVWFEFQINDWGPPDSVLQAFQRKITSLKSGSNAQSPEYRSGSKPKIRYVANEFDHHLMSTLKSNPHLINAGEGFRWVESFEFDSGEIADLVFFGPGREIKVLSICTQDTDITYLKAVKAKLWATEMSIERGEVLENEFVQPYLVTKEANEITKQFCENYGVTLLIA